MRRESRPNFAQHKHKKSRIVSEYFTRYLTLHQLFSSVVFNSPSNGETREAFIVFFMRFVWSSMQRSLVDIRVKAQMDCLLISFHSNCQRKQ